MGKYESALPMENFSHWSFVASIEGIQGAVKGKNEQKPKGPEGLPTNGLLLKLPGAHIKEFLLTVLGEVKRPQIQSLSPKGEC